MTFSENLIKSHNWRDAYSPVEDKTFALDMERSSSDVIYAFVPQKFVGSAILLGWIPDEVPIVYDKDSTIGDHVRMFYCTEHWITSF